MHVRVDERRCERQTGRLDHAVTIRIEVLAEPCFVNPCNHAVVDAHVEDRVDPFDGIEHARAAHDDVLRSGASGEHHATSTVVSTATGPVVRRSYSTAMRTISPERT